MTDILVAIMDLLLILLFFGTPTGLMILHFLDKWKDEREIKEWYEELKGK